MGSERAPRLTSPRAPTTSDAPAPSQIATRAPYAHIACCIDDSPASQRALAEARRLHSIGARRLSVVHVGSEPPDYGLAGAVMVRAEFLAEQQAWLESQIQPGESAVFLTGAPLGRAVCEWAAAGGHPDLIVAASYRGLWERIELGSFAAYLARHAPCSVLLVRPTPSGRTGHRRRAG
jgi:nucleotide-binding universal stress UspA family protein